MARMKFGSDESFTCIQNVKLKGPNDEALCVAYKTTTQFFVAGVYVRDDGYVLRVRANDTYLPMPAGEELASLQAQGLLPDPLPQYSLSAGDYLVGYSLWLIVALVIGVPIARSWMTRRRHEAAAAIPPTVGPPMIEKDGDRFIAEETQKFLQRGEHVQHQAYVTDPVDGGFAALGAKGYFASLTERRLILIHTKIGALKPILENHGVEDIARSRIIQAAEDEYVIRLELDDGTERRLKVPQSEKYFSNQKIFVRDVPRLLGPMSFAA